MTPLGREWLRKAEDDRRTLLVLLGGRPRVHSVICFHCQQLAEKYLKGLMHERGLLVPRTYVCERLVSLLVPTDPTLKRFDRGARGLTPFAVDPRYPDLSSPPTVSRSHTAWNAAERIRAEVRRRL